ncbi:hypothetical protein PHYBLDRAFT_118927 [Phycomyces blakesleeanus NRRL 1555(-)]|uniref:DDE-1 domain-containing protein n=1 Tax=Phycomyces blakesleeanus (strain ATCC 8743b / DSM 1359 / FGSC 10004 / NBRC 33097 / NRRL 1555) TaxID=763407 RepID=A0A167JV09_PHYB8|nr:hypothetical protein PHYBLDRAFT_118927 [Phycomyces blakesleeanus NRRL 1555(-)]OAD66758.1 hypothetical protein PHYBLDRAFT_118927 [Phycomyces blakesleeanus NRRL 1555(-)]|eukprot:XP_018284798.1 hypothetical protein PHYBLDRAFT_118927 [Phycomyces blakesleeanus NRRL 1555(-)]
MKKRLGYKGRRMHSTAASAPVDTMGLKLRIENIKKLKTYKRRDILNFDETDLFYKQPPTTTISKAAVSGQKFNKTWLTVALIANSDDSLKLELFIIGKHAKPRCFSKKTSNLLQILYKLRLISFTGKMTLNTYVWGYLNTIVNLG